MTYDSSIFPINNLPECQDISINYSEKISATIRDYYEEEYSMKINQAYIGTQLYILAFSVVQPRSFENIVAKWVPMVRHHTPEAPVILVGTMIEQRTHVPTLENLYARGESFITYEEGERLAKKMDCITYLEVSSVRQQGVQEVFDAVWRCVHANRIPKKKNCKLQ
jgi:Ras-related C3 botulinum toxin substrate 1